MKCIALHWQSLLRQKKKKMGVSIKEFIIATLWMHVSLVVSVAYIAIVKIRGVKLYSQGRREAKSWQYLGISCTHVN